jgi:hypothetical protein
MSLFFNIPVLLEIRLPDPAAGEAGRTSTKT